MRIWFDIHQAGIFSQGPRCPDPVRSERVGTEVWIAARFREDFLNAILIEEVDNATWRLAELRKIGHSGGVSRSLFSACVNEEVERGELLRTCDQRCAGIACTGSHCEHPEAN